jgi:phosphoglycerol transferase MdoB-like AlkP superfamily enzyme
MIKYFFINCGEAGSIKILNNIKRFFDAAKKIAENLKKRKPVWITATVLFWLMPAYYLFMTESFNDYPRHVLSSISHRPLILLFGLIIFYLLFAAVFAASKKPWVCLIIFSLFVTSFSLTNYIKFSLTGEHFMPHDIIMAGNLNQLFGFMTVRLTWWAHGFIIITVLATIILGIFAKDAPFRFYARLPAAAAVAAVIIIFFSGGASAGRIFNKFGMFYESTDNQESNYRANGFVGAFSINIASFSIQRPYGYSEAALKDALGRYSAVPPSPDFNDPDIIIILSESFWDPRLLPGTTIEPGPMENFDMLSSRENAHSGMLVVPAYGGGTIRTEFEILTGLSVDALPSGVVPYNILRKPIGSYVSHYKDMGYDAIAIHPYLARFYSRNRALPYLGFDIYHGEADLAKIPEVEIIRRGGWVSDETFVNYIKYFLNEAEKNSGAPLFLFGITMENHQTYRYKYDWREFDITAYNPYLSESDLHNYQNFTQGIYNADKALGSLAEFIDGRNRPTVLVYFGDHLPSLGPNFSAYLDTGFVENAWDRASRKKLYSTPFIIYANFPLNHEAAPYGTISSYDLLNITAKLIGAGQTSYMSYLDALREILPYYNRRMSIGLTDEQRELLQIKYFATYRAMRR